MKKNKTVIWLDVLLNGKMVQINGKGRLRKKSGRKKHGIYK